MITEKEKIKSKLLSFSITEIESMLDEARSAVVKNTQEFFNALVADGFEEVSDIHDAYLTKDGRELIWVEGKPYALRPDIHKKRTEEALSAAKEENEKTETKSVVGTESLATITCPKCHDALQYSKVCPACAAGQAGYHHRYICVCGVDFVTKERL